MKPAFRATKTGLVRVGSDGRVFVPTSSGEQQFFETAPPAGAVHSNPGFEAETAGIPDVWDFIWASGTTDVETDADTVYSGARSLRVSTTGGGEQVVMSDTFDVLPRDRVEFAVFGVATDGVPAITLGLLTGASGVPVFLDPTNYENNENAPAPVGSDWGMFRRQAVVPRGHTKARLFFRIGPSVAEDVTVFLDLSSSTVTAADVKDTDWQPLTYSPNWADTGFGWAPGEWRVEGDGLYLRGMATRSVSASGASAVIATVGADRLPAFNNLVGGGYFLSGGVPSASQVYINASGQIITTVSVPTSGSVPFDAGPIQLL